MRPYLPAFLLAITMFLPASGLADSRPADRALATVDEEVITLSDYVVFLKSLGLNQSDGTVLEEMLKRMMEEKVILHEARRKGIEVTDAETDKLIEEFRKESSLSQEDMEKQLKKENMDMRGYRRLLKDRLMSVRLIETEVDSKVIITDKEVEDYYKANEKDYLNGPEKAELMAIFLRLNADATVTEITDMKRKALKISAQLEQGESFEALVNEYDDDNLKSRGGRWGEFERGTLIPLLDSKVFSMKVGEMSGPLWVRDGVYILKLVGKTGGTVKPVKEVGAEIAKHLRSQKREKLLNEWMKTLWEKASIKIN